MRINIKALAIKLSPSIEKYIEEKIGGLDKIFGIDDKETIEAQVEVGKPSQHHRSGDIFYAEANISLPGQFFRAQAEAQDVFAAIDQIKDELQQEIKKNKEKQLTINRRKGRSFKKARALSPLARLRPKARVKT